MSNANSVIAGGAARAIERVVTIPPFAPGFMGAGHTASPVIDPKDFEHNDPFIVLMDDRMDLPPGSHAGEAHPHAGFEIATFVVEGELRDRDEGFLRAGDVVWMTAGTGVIHNEDVTPLGKSRILQLWMTMPSGERWIPPRIEHMPRDEAPERREPGVVARVYNGSSGAVTVPSKTRVPMTLVDIQLEPGATFDQQVPASYNGFVYVLEGDLVAGPTRERTAVGQVAWLGDPASDAIETLRLVAGDHGARAVLYAGERQRVPIVSHGPFIGETRADLMRVSGAYVRGELPRVSQLRSS
jgi:redox-sensitive bicupin YhaK (pirin superfamily)